MSRPSVDRRAFLALGAGALGVAVAPSWLKPREQLVRLTIPVMGTVGELAVPARHEGMARQALSAAAAELRRVEALMTRFTADSDVGRFNMAAAGSRVPVAPETAEVVRESLHWARRTGGDFDPTLGRLATLWDPMNRATPPEAMDVRAARSPGAGWTALTVSAAVEAPTLASGPGSPTTQLDLGGIAKGYAVDRATEVLREHGIYRGLVNVGGDLMAMGDAPGGRPWRVGIRDPRRPDGLLETLSLEDEAVATSGDYLRYFESGGRRYHHILDGRTGMPVDASVRTVTVVASNVMTADAAATTAFTRGGSELDAVFASAPGTPRMVHHG